MTVKAILWTYDKRHDGSCNIKIYVNHNGQKKYFKTQYYAHEKDWNKKKGCVKSSNPTYVLVNSHLALRLRGIEDELLKGASICDIGSASKDNLIHFLSSYIDEIIEGRTALRPSSAKNYKSLLTRLTQFIECTNKKSLTFDDITLDFYSDFKDFLIPEKCALVGFGKHIKIIKTVMRIAEDQGVHNNTTYRSRLFKRHRSGKSIKIFLNTEEIKRIEALDLRSHPGLDFERDRFLVSYYFLMRYDDSRAISKELFFHSGEKMMIRYQQRKTKNTCIIPVSKKAQEILKKRNYNFKMSSNPQANRNIKTVCAMAEIKGTSTIPKWSLVTTHTARRSAATNLALQNVSTKIIADLGGWEDLDTLRIYLRASGLDTALIAHNLDFFK